MLDKYKGENEFYSLIGIKYKTFMKMADKIKGYVYTKPILILLTINYMISYHNLKKFFINFFNFLTNIINPIFINYF